MDNDSQTVFIIFGIIVGFLVNLWIMYAIIKSAIKSGTKELENKLSILSRLKYLDLKKNGITDEEIKSEVDKVYKIE